MPTNCAVPGCNGRGGFSFPQDKTLRKAWCIAIRRLNPRTKNIWEPAESSVVCERHFRTDEIHEPGQKKARRKLKQNTVPSIFSFNKEEREDKVSQARNKRSHDRQQKQDQESERAKEEAEEKR